MKRILLLGALMAASISYAQVTFDLTTFTATYENLENATAVPGTEGMPWDDPDFMVPIGFDFTLGETTSDQLIQFGFGAELAIQNGQVMSLISYGADLMDVSNIEGEAPSTISYTTEGTIGNRIFKIQYANCGFYEELEPWDGEPSANNRIDFQIWLYEVNNAIEYRFGPHTITDLELIFYGDPGPALYVVADYNFMDDSFNYFGFMTGPTADPTMVVVDEIGENMFVSLSGVPENGRVYRLSENTVSATEENFESFSIFPTLATDFVQIEGDKIQPTDTYRIYELSGRKIDSGNLTNGNRINVNHLSQGMYIIEISGHQSARKFMKN